MTPSEEITPENAITLEQWVIDMIKKKRTKEPAFQALLTVYGREKFEAIWKAHKENEKNGSNGL